MAEADFEIVYDGPALELGAMSVHDLAPALLALGDIFTLANSILYPEREQLSLNIKATSKGSFALHLMVESKRAWDQFVDIFSSDEGSALANFIEIVVGTGGLFMLLKKLGVTKVLSREHVEPNDIRLTFEDGTTLEISGDTLRLAENVEVRRRARQVIAPLTREGIDSLTFVENETTLAVITETDVDAFDVPEDAEVLLDSVQEMVLQIPRPTLQGSAKWRFSRGRETFEAAIDDQAFLNRVEQGIEAFRNGDLLRCRVRVIQTRKNDRLHVEHRVVEVLEHIPRPTQMTLDEGLKDDGES